MVAEVAEVAAIPGVGATEEGTLAEPVAETKVEVLAGTTVAAMTAKEMGATTVVAAVEDMVEEIGRAHV